MFRVNSKKNTHGAKGSFNADRMEYRMEQIQNVYTYLRVLG